VAARATRLTAMANSQRFEFSGAFDAMLAQNRKRFDDLYPRGGSQIGKPAVQRPGSSERAIAGAAAASGGLASPPLDAQSPVVRRLNARFGGEWRYEISGQERDGDEVIVLCKLIVGKDGAVRTQFGRATISAAPIAGASGGVRFSAGAGPIRHDERDALRRAAEAALANCADLI
jgi:hypothetical protein